MVGSGGPVVGQPHRVAELGTVHDPGGDKRHRVQRATQFAVEISELSEVHPLADQRRSPATKAALPIGVATVSGATNQRELEFGGPLIRVLIVPHSYRVFGALPRVPADHNRLPRGHKRLPFLNAHAQLHHPSRDRMKALTRGLSWLDGLVRVGKSQPVTTRRTRLL